MMIKNKKSLLLYKNFIALSGLKYYYKRCSCKMNKKKFNVFERDKTVLEAVYSYFKNRSINSKKFSAKITQTFLQ